MKKSLPRLDSKFIVIAISVLLLLYFIVMPLLVLIYDSLFINGVFDISNYKDVYGKKVNWKALTNTIQLSLRSRWPGWWAVRICRERKPSGRSWLPVI